MMHDACLSCAWGLSVNVNVNLDVGSTTGVTRDVHGHAVRLRMVKDGVAHTDYGIYES